MKRLFFVSTALLLASTTGTAATCEEVRAQIEAKIRAKGVENLTVTVVDAAAAADGKVVGNCEQGAKKIVYVRGAPSANKASPAKSGASAAKGGEAIVTECKDGTAPVGGACKK